MEERSSADRRLYVRYPMATTVEFYHGPSRRYFRAQTVDISAGGVLMYVPASAPVAPGHPIRLTIGSRNRPELAGLSSRPLDATVVRVDRQRMLSHGMLPVGVRFAQPQTEI